LCCVCCVCCVLCVVCDVCVANALYVDDCIFYLLVFHIHHLSVVILLQRNASRQRTPRLLQVTTSNDHCFDVTPLQNTATTEPGLTLSFV